MIEHCRGSTWAETMSGFRPSKAVAEGQALGAQQILGSTINERPFCQEWSFGCQQANDRVWVENEPEREVIDW